MSVTTTYHIKLPQFEGPFDLLLFFIERDELDIYNIPIAKITQDFLDYIQHLEELNIEVASEFILFAATLMHIKARMLLPHKELDEQGNEIDPRTELVERLLEYKLYKDAAEKIQTMEGERLLLLERGNVARELSSIAEKINVEMEMHTVSLFKLMQIFEKVMERFRQEQNRPKHMIVKYPYTIEEAKAYLLGRVKQLVNASFEQLFDVCQNRIHAIFTFLAMLELIQQQVLKIKIGTGYNNFILSLQEA